MNAVRTSLAAATLALVGSAASAVTVDFDDVPQSIGVSEITADDLTFSTAGDDLFVFESNGSNILTANFGNAITVERNDGADFNLTNVFFSLAGGGSLTIEAFDNGVTNGSVTSTSPGGSSNFTSFATDLLGDSFSLLTDQSSVRLDSLTFEEVAQPSPVPLGGTLGYGLAGLAGLAALGAAGAASRRKSTAPASPSV